MDGSVAGLHSSSTAWGTANQTTWYVVNGDVTVGFDGDSDGPTVAAVTVGNSDNGTKSGIFTAGGITVRSGTVIAQADDGVDATPEAGYGIYALTGNVTVSGGTVNALAKGTYTDGSNTVPYHGIYAAGGNAAITVSGANTSVATFADRGAGLCADDGTVSISGGTVHANDDPAAGDYGIFAEKSVTGGTVTAQGITAIFGAKNASFDLSASGVAVTADGAIGCDTPSNVRFTGGTAASDSYVLARRWV